MTSNVVSALVIALLLPISGAAAGPPQTVAQGDAIKAYFSGQQMLVTYREGGAAYGTFYFLQVHFCRTGRYLTFGQSRKTTVLGNEQVNNFTDAGMWEIAAINGQPVLKSVSVSGQVNVLPVRLLPNGGVWLGDGISVTRQGAARCEQ